MKVILLVIDTLRADHLGCYGYGRDTSPTIDQLAKEGVLFENAYPTDVPTQPSFTSMFTGLRGIHTGIVSHSETENLSEQTPCIPEILSRNGVATAAMSTLYMMRRWFARGFRYYMNPIAGIRERLQQVDADEINAVALPWIKENKNRDFFIFIHYWDPHGLYLPPKRYRQLFYEGDECDPENHSLDTLKAQPIWPFTKGHLDGIKEGITDIEYVVAQYDGEIRYTDDNVKQLLELLDELGISEETALILTSDHGESMGEHHFYFDHYEAYETTVHVPLIMRYPQAIPKETRIKGLVQSTICLEPTILNLFGINAPNQLEGKDLVKLAVGEEEPWREIYVNQGLWTAKRAIRTEQWKLIRTIDPAYWETPEIELFDMQDDPEETRNLASDRQETVNELELRMERWLRKELDKRIDPLERIASLGLPSRVWVERSVVRQGMSEKYEERRARIDRSET
jgi:arylsulfatase